MEGFQKPTSSSVRKKVGVARIHEETNDSGSGAECSCGWVKIHKRKIVVQTAVDRHIEKKHKGRAIWA